MSCVGVVVIGRNEGRRLIAALASVPDGAGRRVYVDSGSTDGSVAAARAAGAEVVELDTDQPFTAARARNAGVARLRTGDVPEVVQFVDGDCQFQPGWIATALDFLRAHPEAAMVCGRLRERFPDASVYNSLCDKEWETPIGLAKACGGIAMIRMSALQAVGGYDPSLIAGEEPEMCLRMRALGWQVWRLDAEMALHDADMHRFGQWWMRMRRAGHAWAEGAALHGAAPERHGVAELRRALAWGLVLPLAILALALVVTPWALLGGLAYPLQVLRLSRRGGWTWATFVTLGKVAEAQGALAYWWRRLARRRAQLIEYK